MIGIDYGGKRIGVAVSDSGVLASPHSVIANEGDVIAQLDQLGRQLDVAAYEFVDHLDRRHRFGELVCTRLHRVSVPDDLHVDERDVLVAKNAGGPQPLQDCRGPLTFPYVDAARRLGIALVLRLERAPEKPAAAGKQQHRKHENRE